MRVKSKKKPAKKPAKAPDVRVGAASALTRLEAEEASLFAAYETAKAEKDALEIKIARDAWLKCSESLRKFDLLVEAARKEVGELVSRADVERWLSNLGSCLHYALLRAVTTDKCDLHKAWDACDSAFTSFIQGYDPKRDAPFQDVPDWMHLSLFRQRMGAGHALGRLHFYKRRSLIVSALDHFLDDPRKAETWLRSEVAKLDAEIANQTKEKPYDQSE